METEAEREERSKGGGGERDGSARDGIDQLMFVSMKVPGSSTFAVLVVGAVALNVVLTAVQAVRTTII
ncbi:unnamed protein product [Echinostoma caproni]|uniref:ABC transporter permease n=1 Tax=Echinostoma caproni TaxID=27848 RepID=A0A183A7M5_9TREM|nr:unnamed protein product [Echinostoma caproni]